MVLIGDVIAIAIVIGLIAVEAVPLTPQRIFWGVFIFLLGLFPFLRMIGWIKLDIYAYPLMKFVAIFIVFIVGELLFSEGLKEDNVFLKITSMGVGVLIIIITYLPWMYEYHAVSFVLPSYTPLIDFVIYLCAGILTVVGALTTSS